MSDGSGRGASRIGLYALVLAGVAALVALGLRYREGRQGAPPAVAPTSRSPANVDAMVAGLEAKLKADPGDTEGWRMLGWSRFNMNRFPEAARAYARAAALSPADAGLWSALGEALVYAHGKGVDVDAAHAFARALEIDPRDARARYFMAVRKDLAGDHKGAVEDWIGVLRDAPADAPYAQSVRTLVETVARRERIDIAGRLPASASPVAAPSGAVSNPPVPTDAIPGPSQSQMQDAARMSPSEQDAMARGMVDRLAQRLAANPGDETGWIRLMRARLVLGDKAGAQAAHAQARKAFAGDGDALARIDAAARQFGTE